jgi:hypothetical protein
LYVISFDLDAWVVLEGKVREGRVVMVEQVLISVDPQRIKFNPHNPRKHRGTELVRLRESIKKHGILQPPIVRNLPGNFFEAIDGEGRTLVAQEEGFEQIPVLSVGVISADEALMLLQASNTIRSFNVLAECKGLANLHRRGMTMKMLAKEFSCSETKIQDMVGIGYFPDDLFAAIQDDIATSETRAKVWTYTLLESALPLRELLPGQTLSRGGSWFSFDGVYSYEEVKSAIEKVIQGEITTREQMSTYVAYRRYEIYQSRFNEELERKLQEELTCARANLEAAKEQEVQLAREDIRTRYEDQISTLQAQLDSLAKRHEKVVREVAKRPEVVAEQERKLREEIEKTQKERNVLQEIKQQAKEDIRKAQLQLQLEAQKNQEQWEENNRRTLQANIDIQRRLQEQELKRTEEELKELYARKDQEQRIKAENTIRGLLSHGIKSLAEAQQVVDHIISPAMLPSVRELGGAHHESLLWAIRSMSEALDRAERKLVDGDISTYVEGGRENGHQHESSNDSSRWT